MEKLTKNKLGQWSLKKEDYKPKIVQVPDYEETNEKSPYEKFNELKDRWTDKQLENTISAAQPQKQEAPIYSWQKLGFKRQTVKPKSTEVHNPESWGPRIDIHPDDIVHHSNPTPENWGKQAYMGDWDYTYVRDLDGRIYQKIFASGPEFGHLNNKYIPTDFHESQSADEDEGILSDASKMGVIFKRPNNRLN